MKLFRLKGKTEYKTTPEEREYQRNWRKKHPGACQAKYANIEERRKYLREYQKERYHNDPEFRQRIIAAASKYCQTEKYRKYRKEYYQKNIENYKIWAAEWRKTHKQEIAEYGKNYRLKKEAERKKNGGK